MRTHNLICIDQSKTGSGQAELQPHIVADPSSGRQVLFTMNNDYYGLKVKYPWGRRL